MSLRQIGRVFSIQLGIVKWLIAVEWWHDLHFSPAGGVCDGGGAKWGCWTVGPVTRPANSAVRNKGNLGLLARFDEITASCRSCRYTSVAMHTVWGQ
ncbi:hypothetical protein K0M31_005884 [Melipona bicolor]|uniref:Uncharacterized protein n=1 Tax=Melipona bicolor TaxID=60889 RepID=A0AA40FVB3_9HYME|nr:hypothetical protein K0M31_005884 [Melipona bicolor]